MQTIQEVASRIRSVRHGGRVERCHAIPHLGSYSNAAHQWGVAQLIHALWPEDFPRLATTALFHDVSEAWVGDIPSPVLGHNPLVNRAVQRLERKITGRLGVPHETDLSPEDFAKFKAADRIEFLLWSLDQKRLGNNEVSEGIKEVLIYLQGADLPAPAGEYVAYLAEHGEEVARASSVIREAVAEIRAEGGES